MFVGWNFLGTFKLASAGPFVASFLSLMGFRFDLSCVYVFSDHFFCIWIDICALRVLKRKHCISSI